MSKKIALVKNKNENVQGGIHVSTDEVKTVPNQSMSIRDILYRNTQGMAYTNYKTPYYEDQAQLTGYSFNKLRDMEPVEKLQYLAEVKEKVANLTKEINAENKRIAEEKQKIEDAKIVPNVTPETDHIVTGTETGS